MKWVNDIPVEDNHNRDNQLRRSWDKDGELRKYKRSSKYWSNEE